MPTIHANGLDIAYERPGEGPPLLLLHGATGSGRDHFAPILPSLATRFTVFAPDARSHAGTRWDVGDGWTAEGLATCLQAVAAADAEVKGGGRDPVHAVERVVLTITGQHARHRDG